VTSNVQVGDFKPQIEVDVVLLAPLEGLIVLAARAGDDEELVVEAADRVAVAGVLHVIHAEAVEQVCVVVHDLEALLEGGWLSLDVTAANKEDLVAGRLDVGEVVLEGRLHVDLSAEHLFGRQFELVDVL